MVVRQIPSIALPVFALVKTPTNVNDGLMANCVTIRLAAAAGKIPTAVKNASCQTLACLQLLTRVLFRIFE